MDIGEANTCAASNDDESGEACGPWFIAVGFSLPHEPMRFPKKFWDLYETDKTFGASTPHPKRPLGSPIFAYGDMKEKFMLFLSKPPTLSFCAEPKAKSQKPCSSN